MRIWSELRGMRVREQAADVLTLGWLALWAVLASTLYAAFAGFGAAARSIRDGGTTLVQGGRDLGDALSGIPLVGERLRDAAQDAFAGAGAPIMLFGIELEGLVALLAAVVALLAFLVPTALWLDRYGPWRVRRLRAMRAGHQAIRVAPGLPSPAVQEVLALRAVTRLDYDDLLTFTPDPIGDWAAGRHDRLARAELASVGLRP